MPYEDNAGQKSMGGLMEALKQLQQSNQYQQNLQHETDTQSRQFQQQKNIEAYKKELARQQQEEGIKRAIALKAQLDAGGKGKSYKVGLTSGGGVDISENERDPMMLLDRVDARNDRDLTNLGNRITKAGIPQTMAGVANLEQSTANPEKSQGGLVTNPNYQIKSTGPVANTVRNLPGGETMLNIGEKLHLMPQGASVERTALARLMNQDIRQMSGTAVTAYEQGRQNVEKGMTGGGDPELVKLGTKQMLDAIQSTANTIKASTRPSIVDTYKNQGGSLTLEDYVPGYQQSQRPDLKQMLTPPAKETEEQEYLRLKSKHRR